MKKILYKMERLPFPQIDINIKNQYCEDYEKNNHNSNSFLFIFYTLQSNLHNWQSNRPKRR